MSGIETAVQAGSGSAVAQEAVRVLDVNCSAQSLARVLGNAVLFVGKDATRPALTAVQIVVSDGKITATGCDSYALGIDSLAVDGIDGIEASILVVASELSSVIKALAKWKYQAEMRVADGTLTLSVDGASWSLRGLDAQYPDVARIMPEESSFAPLSGWTVGINPLVFATLAKVQSVRGRTKGSYGVPTIEGGGMRMEMSKDAQGPIRVSFLADNETFRGLVMPTRIG